MFWEEVWKILEFFLSNFSVLEIKFYIYLNRRVFAMHSQNWCILYNTINKLAVREDPDVYNDLGRHCLYLTIKNPKFFEEFRRHGHHLGYWNWTILAIPNFHVTLMPPIKCWLYQTYGLAGDVPWSISRWPPLDIGTERFKHFWISITPQCLPSGFSSTRLTVQTKDVFVLSMFVCRCGLKIFKFVAMVAILHIGMEWF